MCHRKGFQGVKVLEERTGDLHHFGKDRSGSVVRRRVQAIHGDRGMAAMLVSLFIGREVIPRRGMPGGHLMHFFKGGSMTGLDSGNRSLWIWEVSWHGAMVGATEGQGQGAFQDTTMEAAQGL